ncbi:MAG TPA: carboxypeptidase regulatory-like domain-containing protein, partial [Blastocatellia bacterium]|nr:carboxypeptidase regulatory-like domain-containing protein [Blastocatellia bacterium]
AKAALRFGLEKTLGQADRFNIVAFESSLHNLSPQMLGVSRANIERALDFVDKLKANGGTNINDALVAAMRMFSGAMRAQNLVFITDGQPTDSVTDPATIANNVRAANAGRARLFCFGVGFTVNNRLLEQLAAENRGVTSNIADQSDLNEIVSKFFARVSQPVLSNLKMDFGRLQTDRVYPSDLPDLYTRSQIKVFGRYRNPEDLRDSIITLTGEMNEREQRFEFGGMSFPAATNDNEFLPKLWATERVSALLAQERLYNSPSVFRDEIVQLAREFNLVTPYTSMYVPTTLELEREKANESSPTRTGAPSVSVTASAADQRVDPKLDLDPRVLSARRVENLAIMNRGVFGAAPFNVPGTVTDANGAVVPDAAVTIVDQNTGMRRELTTDSSGNFSIAGLPPGKYSVQVAATGFKTARITDVSVQPGQTQLGGVHLEVANVSEAVTVTGSAPIVSTDSAHSSIVIESRSVEDLPNLDPAHSLTRLIPGAFFGATPRGSQPAEMGRRPEFDIAIGAAHPRSISHTLDGQENADLDGRPAISVDNLEAVEMLHVLTTRATGDVSLTGAAAINLVTPAGSNQFHGSAFDYYLNRGLGALSPIERRNGIDEPPTFKNTMYGGVLGGPIRRDRAFFFASLLGETQISRPFVDSTASFIVPTESTLARLMKNYPESQPVLDIFKRGPLATVGPTRITRSFSLPVFGAPMEFGEVGRSVAGSAEGYEVGSRFSLNATP